MITKGVHPYDHERSVHLRPQMDRAFMMTIGVCPYDHKQSAYLRSQTDLAVMITKRSRIYDR